MEPTREQKDFVRWCRDTFGKNAVKAHASYHDSGILHLELPCQAGVNHWHINPDGTLRSQYLQSQLRTDGDDATTARSGPLPRNAQDDNDT